MRLQRIIVCLSIIVCAIGCAQKLEPPETDSKVLNKLVRTAPVQYLNLDEGSNEIIELAEEDIILDISQRQSIDSIVIGQIKYVTKFNDLYYVYDSIANKMYGINDLGLIKKVLGREGKGPGEYLYVTSVKSNLNTLFISDVSNARINRYNRNTEVVNALKPFTPNLATNKIDVNKNRLLLGNSASSGFEPSLEDEGLITISNNKNLFDTLGTIMPRIVPSGYQPAVFNEVDFSINDNNLIASSYLPLPWIFLFNEKFRINKTIIFKYSVFNDMDLPELKLFKPKGNKGFGGAVPLSTYCILNNGNILVSIRDVIVHLKLKENQEYEVSGKLIFKNPQNETSLWIREILPLGESNFVATDGNLLFRFKLDK